jgi:hypothetical protein
VYMVMMSAFPPHLPAAGPDGARGRQMLGAGWAGTVLTTRVWLDELDGGGASLLAPHAVLAMFERARSAAIGVSTAMMGVKIVARCVSP